MRFTLYAPYAVKIAVVGDFSSEHYRVAQSGFRGRQTLTVFGHSGDQGGSGPRQILLTRVFDLLRLKRRDSAQNDKDQPGHKKP